MAVELKYLSCEYTPLEFSLSSCSRETTLTRVKQKKREREREREKKGHIYNNYYYKCVLYNNYYNDVVMLQEVGLTNLLQIARCCL